MTWTVARDLPGTLTTMAAPPGGAALPAALARLRDTGAHVLVCLLPPGQVAALDLAGEPAAAARAGLGYRSVPIPDFGVPDLAEVAGPLRELGAELDRGRHVVVHCWGGVGRSSLVAAALLVLRGTAPDAAWAQVAAARGVPVPETDAQRRWVSRLVPDRPA